MKTIRLFFAILSAATFLAACNNTETNQRQDTDTTYMEPTPPVGDTMMNDTMMNDTMMGDTM